MSNIDLVEIYCATLVWLFEIYPPIDPIPTSASTSLIGGYYQQTLQHRVILTKISCDAQLWRLPSAHRI